MNRRELIAASAALLSLGAATPADLKGDVEILRRALRLHPGLYRYATPTEIDSRLSALDVAFVDAPTLDARYLVLSRFLATIRCGHSYCNFFNQRKAVASALFDRKTRLPFHFIWLDGRMVVTADPSGLGVPVGAEVMTINGRPSPELLASLMAYARADGHNDAKRAALLGVTGSDTIEFFDVFQGLVYGAPADGSHRLSLRRADGRRLAIDLPAIGRSDRRAQMRQRDYTGAEPVWDWVVRRDDVAVLTMPSWALFDSKWDWRTWLDDRLDSLGGARGLIIDLRDNEGGQDCGDAILERLTPAPIVRPGAELRVRFRKTAADLDPYLDTWDNSFRTLGADAVEIGGGFYRLQGERADDRILPRGPRLELKVATLIGPVDSSATFQFADKARGLTKRFGQATGGNQRGINGGCFFFVRLPASGIEFDLPLIGYFPPGRPPDAGLAPDVFVRPTVADVAAGYDRTLETAARWIIG